jgi:hypothetical protein
MKFSTLILLAVLLVVLFLPAGLFAGDLGSPLPIEQRVTELERRVAALEQRTGLPAKSTAAVTVTAHPVGTVGRTADGQEVICTPTGWLPTVSAAPVVTAVSGPIASTTTAVVSPAAPIVSPFGSASSGFTTVCGPNGCSLVPATSTGSPGPIRRILGR